MLQDPDLLSVQEVRSKVEKAWAASRKFRAFSQEQVDHIVEEMAAAARGAARKLAEFAVQETGYGNAADKYSKNMLAADLLPKAMRGMKTVGVLREIPEQKIVEMAEPVGVVAAILPTTNPTSTAMYKALISVKAGNAGNTGSGIYQESLHLHPLPRALLVRVLNAKAAGQDRVRLAGLSAVPGVRQDESRLEAAWAVWSSVCAAGVDFRVAAVHLLVAAVCASSLSSSSLRCVSL